MDEQTLSSIQVKVLNQEKTKIVKRIGRPKKYETPEEAKLGHAAKSLEYYHRTKDLNKLTTEKERAEVKIRNLEEKIKILEDRLLDPNETTNKIIGMLNELKTRIESIEKAVVK